MNIEPFYKELPDKSLIIRYFCYKPCLPIFSYSYFFSKLLSSFLARYKTLVCHWKIRVSQFYQFSVYYFLRSHVKN